MKALCGTCSIARENSAWLSSASHRRRGQLSCRSSEPTFALRVPNWFRTRSSRTRPPKHVSSPGSGVVREPTDPGSVPVNPLPSQNLGCDGLMCCVTPALALCALRPHTSTGHARLCYSTAVPPPPFPRVSQPGPKHLLQDREHARREVVREDARERAEITVVFGQELLGAREGGHASREGVPPQLVLRGRLTGCRLRQHTHASNIMVLRSVSPTFETGAGPCLAKKACKVYPIFW